MKRIKKNILTISLVSTLLISCFNSESIAEKNLDSESKNEMSLNLASTKITEDPDQKKYWYNNEAELTSYELKQARYGEIHDGKAVLIYVTEHFSLNKNTKADNPNKNDIPILKLNFTKKFNTGIYPYSMMTSTFFPFQNGKNSLKISSSSQEWCGNTFMDLKNRKDFKLNIKSYFEGESKDNLILKKSLLEDDIWSMIRLKPDDLPIGEIDIIPSFMLLRFLHKEVKPYKAKINKTNKNDKTFYELDYPDLERKLVIEFENKFPYKILGWEETYISGWGENKKKLTTTAKIIKTIKSAYWNKHSNKDKDLRKNLGLE